MTWQRRANRALRSATGLELTRAGLTAKPARAGGGLRLLTAPIFLLCPVRSGSTLLRVILDSHSQLYAPPELHLRDLKVNVSTKWVKAAVNDLGLTQKDLQELLWDRMLAHILDRSGKRYLVEKTPNDLFMWKRISRIWPDARYIFLIRHPAAIAFSWHDARSWDLDAATTDALRYLDALEQARRSLPGLTVRYEELTAEPERVVRQVCAHLDVAFEPGMLDYGGREHGSLRAGLGDWKAKIRSGRIQSAGTLPADDEIPAELREISARWGYLGG